MVATLEAAPSAAFAYTDAWVLDDPTGRIRATTAMSYHRPPTAPPADPDEFLLLLLDRNFIFTSVTVRRAVLEAVGGYDERLRYGEDFELWVRIVAAGYPVTRVGELLAIHRDRAESLTSDTAKLYAGICLAYSVIGEKTRLDPRARAVVDARKASWERQLKAVTHPSVRDRMRQVARRIKHRTTDSRLWLATPPPLVSDTLLACCPRGGVD
jgi:GT2 family glycosyltransferase